MPTHSSSLLFPACSTPRSCRSFSATSLINAPACPHAPLPLLCLQYAKIVQKLGFPATFKEFKVQNIVGSTDVKFPIRLEGLAFGHQLFSNVRLCPSYFIFFIFFHSCFLHHHIPIGLEVELHEYIVCVIRTSMLVPCGVVSLDLF